MKNPDRESVTRLDALPNVGKSIAKDFHLLGIMTAQELKGKDAMELYRQLNALTGTHQDPCVLDVFMSAIDFMNGTEAKPWWAYTSQRKALLNKEA